jgi:hypothetical protein
MSKDAATTGERRVLAEAPTGKLVDLSELPDEQRVVSADVIRRLCVGPDAKNVDPRGIRIKNAHIVDQLDLSFCIVPHPLRFAATTFDATPDLSGAHLPALWIEEKCSLPALHGKGIQLDRDFVLSSSSVRGEVQLRGARIGGDLAFGGATLINEGGKALAGDEAEINGDALSADNAEINGDVLLDAGFSATGTVRLPGAKIGGDLTCSGATLTNEGGDALVADGADINGGVFLREGFSATGTVRLLGARIGRDLSCRGATLANAGGDALAADGAEMGGGLFLHEGFNATGEVRLPGATVGRDLTCSGATLTNEGGNALYAHRAEITGSVFLDEGFSATGTMRLPGAKIGGQLKCSDATLVNTGGLAFAATDASIGSRLIFREVRVTGGVDLFRASAATLDDDLGRPDDPLGSWRDVQPLILDGFAYACFGHGAEWSSKLRGHWIKQSTGFEHGAWQQLIEVYRAQGRDDEATRAAIMMHRDRVRRAGLPRYRRWGRHLLGAFVGHGYRSWYAGVWAVAIIIGFGFIVGHWSRMFVAAKQGVTGHPSGYPERAAYAVDAFLPIVDLGQTDRWTPTGWIRWVDWLVILLGWSLTTLFVVGFTKVVRIE